MNKLTTSIFRKKTKLEIHYYFYNRYNHQRPLGKYQSSMVSVNFVVCRACPFKRRLGRVMCVSGILMMYGLLKVIGEVLVNSPIDNVSIHVERNTSYAQTLHGDSHGVQLSLGKYSDFHLESEPRIIFIKDKGTFMRSTPKQNKTSHLRTHHHHAYVNQTAGKSLTFRTEGHGIDNLPALIRNSSIVNPHPFKYIIQPRGLCEEDNLYLIIYVHSAPRQLKRRELIRRTWGNPALHKVKFALFFALGVVPHDGIFQQTIEEEAERHNDILQEDFEDTYRNLSIKAVAALRWIDFHCQNVKYVLKVDDDTFVNTFNYLKYLKSLEAYGFFQSNTILCAVWDGMTVLRKGKWNVTREDFNASSYPRYCSGCAFTFTADVARAIHRVSYHVPFLWVDDAYITGVLPHAIGNITYKKVGSTYEMKSNRLSQTFTGEQRWRYTISSDVHNLTTAQNVWNNISKFHETNVH